MPVLIKVTQNNNQYSPAFRESIRRKHEWQEHANETVLEIRRINGFAKSYLE